MKLYHKVLWGFFLFFAGLLTVYSYTLVDLNLTLFNDPLMLMARDQLIQLGYFHRDTASYIFLILTICALFFHWKLTKHYKSFSFWQIITPLLFVGVLSYPLLSHDLFNYMFDAKILTFYHANPYVMKALDYPMDPWIRFMHWIHRSYPYGPTYLPLTLIPSFISMGKFVLGLYLFKAMSTAFYLISALLLYKMNKKWGIFFATNPLMIYEGLINAHNDLIGVALAVIGIYILFKKKNIWSRAFFLVSGGIKYITLPFLLVVRDKKHILNKVSFAAVVSLILYLSFTQEVQPWYFLALLPFIVYFEDLIYKLSIFFAGLIFSYFPYVRFGEWDAVWKIQMKHNIIFVFAGLNLLYVLGLLAKKKFLSK